MANSFNSELYKHLQRKTYVDRKSEWRDAGGFRR